MKHFPMFLLAAVLAAPVSAPAQFSIEARFGGIVRGSVNLSGSDSHHGNHGAPIRRHPVQQRGHWETVRDQVLVPGYWRDEHVPPTYGWISEPCGHRYWGLVDAGGCRRMWVPDRWETRCRQVWVCC